MNHFFNVIFCTQSLLRANNQQQSLTEQQLLEKDTRLMEYEAALERLQSEKPDATNLLASIESDKIAASRAMDQNQKLKLQLEEIQEAYVKLVGTQKHFFFFALAKPLKNIFVYWLIFVFF